MSIGQTGNDSIIPTTARKWSVASTAFVLILAVIVLLAGWIGGVDSFVRLKSSYAAMVPSTALCLLLLGAGLAYWWRRRDNALPALVAGILAAAISAADLVVSVSGVATGLDSLIWPDAMGSDAMAFATSACCLLASYCLAALARPSMMHNGAYTTCATVGLLAALIAIVGYAFDANALYGVFFFSAMALHTAVAFAILFAALMMARPDNGWVQVLLRSGHGSDGARRLFPIVIGGPFLLCLVALYATDAGLLDANFRLSLLAIVMMALAGAAVLRNAAIENRAERRLLSGIENLEAANADKELLLREVYHRVKNNLQQINALLRIESRKMSDPRLTASFDAMADRVQALGLVHQLLISSPKPSEVNVRQFLETLADNIALGHDLAHAGIHLEVAALEERIHLDIATSLGLLVNELVVNAIKHAFDKGQGGTISVRYHRPDSSSIELVVTDNGRGSDSLATKEPPGIGSVIVRSMVSQMDGKMSIDTRNGTKVSVIMPGDVNERNRYE